MASCWEAAIPGGDSDSSQQMQLLECSRRGGGGEQLTPVLAPRHLGTAADVSTRWHWHFQHTWPSPSPALRAVVTQQKKKKMPGTHRQQPFLSKIKSAFFLCAVHLRENQCAETSDWNVIKLFLSWSEMIQNVLSWISISLCSVCYEHKGHKENQLKWVVLKSMAVSKINVIPVVCIGTLISAIPF